MSIIGGGMGLVGLPGGPLRAGGTRGRIDGSVTGVRYPHPFFDVAQTYLPQTMKQLLRWCRYYFLVNPLINATVCKLSEYPVTDVVFESETEGAAEKWGDYFQDHLQYRSFQVEVGLDFFTYGNAFISVGTPFMKFLTCSSCGWREQAKKCRGAWTFTTFNFRLTCPKCGAMGDAKVYDLPVKNASGVKLIRWNPEDIEITYNDLTGHHTYFYTIPAPIRSDIVVGKKEVVEDIPQIFIQAMKEQKGIVFSPDKIFHMRRPTLASQDRGWGISLLMPVLKDAFYLQIMKKAQETILLEHILPLRIIFPQPASGAADPFTSVNLADWREHIAMEIARWRWDPNYMPILPLPVGNQTIGGDGKALMLTAEMEAVQATIMMGIGVPREFLQGGLSYAGTNVSLRMLENFFLGYIMRHKELLRFVVQEVSTFLEWPRVRGRFKPFKMADDIQRKAYLAQLNQQSKISDETLLADIDLDVREENRRMIAETSMRAEAMEKQQMATATIQAKVQGVMQKEQMKLQQQMAAAQQGPAPGAPGGPDQALQQGGGTPGGQSGQAPADVPQGLEQGQPPAPAEVQPPQVGQQPSTTPDQQFTDLIQSSLKGRAGGVDLMQLAQFHAQQIAQMDPVAQAAALQNLRAQSPELADMVSQLLARMGVQAGAGGSAVDARPLPEQRAPRRASSSVLGARKRGRLWRPLFLSAQSSSTFTTTPHGTGGSDPLPTRHHTTSMPCGFSSGAGPHPSVR